MLESSDLEKQSLAAVLVESFAARDVQIPRNLLDGVAC